MRVITGKAKGRPLKGLKGTAVRPTTDRVKQALFSMLGSRVQGAAFLDLFAGTGQNGIEALSRGAARAVFVDNNPASLKVLAQNLATTGLGAQAQVVRADARVAAERLRRAAPFDVIFLDPPYEAGFLAQVLPGLPDLLAPGGLVVAEHDRRELAPGAAGGLARVRQLTFGDTVLSLYQRADEWGDRVDDSGLPR